MAYLSQVLAALQAYTSSGVTAAVPIPTVTMIEATVRVTASSGSASPLLDVWLESSPDQGANFYPITADIVQNQLATPVAGEVASTINKRNFVTHAGAAAATNYHATFKHVPGDLIRGRWIISGTTPSFTFELYVKGK